jgi:hypothetical protein
MRTYIKLLLSLVLVFGLASVTLAADPTPRPTPIRKATGFDTSVPITSEGSPADVTCNFSYSVVGGAMSLNDTLGLCKLPKGAIITDWYLFMSAQGTAHAISLGPQEAPAVFLTASACGVASGSCAAIEHDTSGLTAATATLPLGGIPSSALAADTYLMMKVTTAATTPNSTAGIIKGWVRYHMHDSGF